MAISEPVRRPDARRPSSVRGQSSGGRRAPSHQLITTILMMISDVVAVLLALLIALEIDLNRILGRPFDMKLALTLGLGKSSGLEKLGYLLWFIACLLVVNHRFRLYGSLQTQSILHELRKTVQSSLTSGLLLCGSMYMLHNTAIPRSVVGYMVLCTAVFECAIHSIWRYSAHKRFERGLEVKNVVVLGASHMGDELRKQIVSQRRLGRMFKGFVTHDGDVAPKINRHEIVGSLDEFRQIVLQHFVDEIIIAEHCSTLVVNQLVELALDLDVGVLVIPGFYDGLTPDSPIQYLGEFPVVSLHRRDDRVLASLIKRTSDLLFTFFILIAIAPVCLIIALSIKLGSPGPVFYVSDRIGRKGRVFRCFKFRTMVVDAEKLKEHLVQSNERDGILFKMRDDPRVTGIGSVLRKYSLDELPQLINVLRGDMSLVGPRPPIAKEVAQYRLEHFRRLEVLPGLTGLWQVRARQDPSFERYVALDLAYVENWSFWLDLKILVRTAGVVIRGTGS